jgi:hypothetical protein
LPLLHLLHQKSPSSKSRIRVYLLLVDHDPTTTTHNDDRQTIIRTSHIQEILKHNHLILRLKDSLIELSPDLTEQEITTINQDYDNIRIAIYYHFRRPHRCRLLYT